MTWLAKVLGADGVGGDLAEFTVEYTNGWRISCSTVHTAYNLVQVRSGAGFFEPWKACDDTPVFYP